MTSQIMSFIEYLIPTDNIMCFFYTHIDFKINSLIDGFPIDLMIIQTWPSFYWATHMSQFQQWFNALIVLSALHCRAANFWLKWMWR